MFLYLGIGFGIRMVGPCFCAGLYYLIYMHLDVFFNCICKVLKKRLGTTFGLIWVVIGLTLVYNICWNHMLAMLVKPGGPTELAVSLFFFIFLLTSGFCPIQKVEQLRKQYKQRETRKRLRFAIEGGGGAVGSGGSKRETHDNDDRFVGISSEVKAVLKYRSKTMD